MVSGVGSGPQQNSASATAASGSTGTAAAAAAPADTGGSDKAAGMQKSFQQVWGEIQSQMGEKPKKAREAKKQLDKDDFMKIMVTQMKFQDPTKPVDAEKMATQLAQITSVEQLKNVNDNLGKLLHSNSEKMGVTNLIGKFITVDKNRVDHIKGQSETMSFGLPEDAEKVVARIVDGNGEIIWEKELENQPKGEIVIPWDGRLKGGAVDAPTGAYLLRVEARAPGDKPIALQLQRTQKVIGVSFEGNEPILLVGDNQRQEKVVMSSVMRVATEAPAPEEAAGKQAKTPAFAAFTPGAGSTTLSDDASKKLAQALAAKENPKEGGAKP